MVDLSATAILRAQNRLGTKAKMVQWIVGNMLDFKPEKPIDLWHDRAAFHFLVDQQEINQYINLLNQHVTKHVILATFSTNGPMKCSGLNISQYEHKKHKELLNENFEQLEYHYIDHLTPFDTKQNYIFSLFKRK